MKNSSNLKYKRWLIEYNVEKQKYGIYAPSELKQFGDFSSASAFFKSIDMAKKLLIK